MWRSFLPPWCTILKYEKACNDLQEAKLTNNRTLIYSKRTLANYYVKTYNITKRHFHGSSQTLLNYNNIIKELRVNSTTKLQLEIDKRTNYEENKALEKKKLKIQANIIENFIMNKFPELQTDEIPTIKLNLSNDDQIKINLELSQEIIELTEEEKAAAKHKAESFIRNHKYITPINNKEYNLNNDRYKKYITADFETVVFNNRHYPFCISYTYLSKINKSNFKETSKTNYIFSTQLKKDLSNIQNLSDEMLLNFWNNIIFITNRNFTKKEHKMVYFHNLNKFDGMFILRLISLLLDDNESGINSTDINITSRNNVIYSIKVKDITFKNSLHLIPGNLNNLAKTFLNEQRLEIDIKFTYDSIVNQENDIIKYCIKDSELLYGIIRSFKENIIKLYNFNPLSKTTTSSLSFNILRKTAINNTVIENSSSNYNTHSFIESSYRGGLSSVIKPIPEEYNLTLIDINSSYPYSMTKDLPTGLSMPLTRKHLDTFNKNIPRINKDKLSLFGFLDVTLKVKETRIISPLVIKYDGKLTDVYGEIRITLFSKEMNFIYKTTVEK